MLLVFIVLILTYRSISFYYFRFKSIVCTMCFRSRCSLNCWLLCFELQINSELWIWRATPGACLAHSWHFREHFCFSLLYICSVVWMLSFFFSSHRLSLSIMYNHHTSAYVVLYVSYLVLSWIFIVWSPFSISLSSLRSVMFILFQNLIC